MWVGKILRVPLHPDGFGLGNSPTLPHGVMVAQEILILLVKVRTLVGHFVLVGIIAL